MSTADDPTCFREQSSRSSTQVPYPENMPDTSCRHSYGSNSPTASPPCEDKPYDYPYQWSYPNTWPPVCFYTVMGLARYGYGEEAERIAVKWMKAVTESFKTTGNLWEKYNVETGTTDVSNEYEMPAMLGWTAGTFICLDDYLAGEMQPRPAAHRIHELLTTNKITTL